MCALAAAAAEAVPKLLRKARRDRRKRQANVLPKHRFAGSADTVSKPFGVGSGPTLKLPPKDRFWRGHTEHQVVPTQCPALPHPSVTHGTSMA